jgi:uncharacterized protein YhjY with autotransporter beta-barrel domain
MKLLRIISVALVAVFTLVTTNMSVSNAAGTYGISCKNNAYGMQLGSDYTQIAYVYNAAAKNNIQGQDEDTYLIGGIANDQAYVGNDCIYSGAADTNGTAVVAGDVARLAVNAIVGAVTNRIDMAYAAKNSGASATGLSFTTQSDGVAMSANKIIGGLSIWADYGTNDFENTQTYTNARLDSMNYDGNASSYSLGVDKTFGKALIGVVVSNLDTDLKTTFNSGTYKQEIDTYGVYLAYRTSIIQIDLGMGTGDSSIDTTRKDLGNDSIITGKTTADLDYSNARIAANFSRGRFSIVPSASFRTMSMDMKAFTDDRPDEVQSLIAGDGLLFTSGNEGNGTQDGLTVTDDAIAARSVDSETMSIGLKVSANLGMIVPYLDISYDSEDTTKASYKNEVGTDGNDKEQAGTNYSSSMKIGGGINFMLGSHIKGGVRAGSINGRDDWEENYVAGSISLGF